MTQVLLVDDDTELAELLRDYLMADGFQVSCAYDGETGSQAALSGQFDIVVLDVTMPVLNGIQALARIRANSQVPVLMLTARGDDTDKIVGLELGADDYVPKPCTPRELAARLRAILKRVQAGQQAHSSNHEHTIGDLHIWPHKRRAQWHGQALELTSTEFSLLELLARHAGNPVSKETLSLEALGRPLTRFDRSIDVHISGIRQKLGLLPNGNSPIETVIRKGYMLVQP